MLVVRLSMTKPITTSDPVVGIDCSATPVDGVDLDAKGITDINIWDDEW